MFVHLDPPKIPKLEVTTLQSGKRFYVTPGGERYPSVTTVLGHGEKQWLSDWRKMLGEDKAAKEQKRCAERGKAVHKLIERHLANEPYSDFTKGVNQEYIKGFNQVKLLLNKIDNIRAQEVALYSDKLRLAGASDLVGEYMGDLAITDFKTSNNNKDREMVQDYFLQCTAYAIMWHERTGESVENIVVIMTVERGMVPLVFRDTIDKYVGPLLKRIDNYYKDQK